MHKTATLVAVYSTSSTFLSYIESPHVLYVSLLGRAALQFSLADFQPLFPLSCSRTSATALLRLTAGATIGTSLLVNERHGSSDAYWSSAWW